ncbi:MAG: sulfatase [Pirellulaceae bacterium]|nr:sulfatase [Pirellulaceae bacterium]
MRIAFTILCTFFCCVAVTETADAAKRNILLIVTDDCNTDLGCYGHPLVQTPNIDRLSQRGTLFRQAYSQYPVCNPSRASFMTGLYPDQTGILSNAGHFRDHVPDVTTMAQMFRKQGYWAGRVGKIYHFGVPDQIGTDGEDDPASWDHVVNPRGIDREVHDRIHSLKKGSFGGTLSWLNLESQSSEHTDGIGATEAIGLLEEHHPDKTDQPFFLAVGFYRPHTPYVAPPSFFDLYPLDKIQPVMEKPGDRDDIPIAALHDRPKQRELTLAQRKEIIQAYYASITLMDEQVGRVVDAVDRLGLADNTTIVFISDHGYHLGAHGLWQKSDLFEGSCHVPMIVVDPDHATGQSSASPVGLIDLYPTLAELADVQAPDHVKGTSLVPILKDPNAAVKPGALSVTISRARQMHKEFTKAKVAGYSLRTKRYRYTSWGGGAFGHELYDYQTDPDEYTNLADKPEHAKTVQQMQRLLKEALGRAKK